MKKVRVAVSLTLLLLTGSLFLDTYDVLPPSWTHGILVLQVIPSITQFFTLFSISAAGFIVVLFVTVMFGRVYCSTICPLGTLQDLIIFVSGKSAKKKHHHRKKPFNTLRYGLLVLTMITALGGTMMALNLLDPFSSFGRILTNGARPLLVSVGNTLVLALESTGLYSLYPVPVKAITLASVAVPGVTLAVLVWMSYRHGRLYCNTLCPVGALLGLFSKVSLYRITLNRGRCIGCNLCEEVCKGGCIDKKSRELDFSRCVGCYNCLAVCPADGLEFRNALAREQAVDRKPTDYKRREIMCNSGLLIAASFGTTQAGLKRIVSAKETAVSAVRTLPLVPPGGEGVEHFIARCTACHLCVSACPSQVLSPSFLEYGLSGIMQPKMDFSAGYCNYECTTCSQVCPSGAILTIAIEQKKLTQVGTAKFVKDNCVVYTEEKDCGACSEHCPTKAVTMVPYKKLVAPEVREENCIGCGACEHACPTKPFKAIYVEGKALHTLAKKPETKKLEEKVREEFPF